MKMDLLVRKQVFRVESDADSGELLVFKMEKGKKEISDFVMRVGITEGSLTVLGSAPDYRDKALQLAILEAVVTNSALKGHAQDELVTG